MSGTENILHVELPGSPPILALSNGPKWAGGRLEIKVPKRLRENEAALQVRQRLAGAGARADGEGGEGVVGPLRCCRSGILPS